MKEQDMSPDLAQEQSVETTTSTLDTIPGVDMSTNCSNSVSNSIEQHTMHTSFNPGVVGSIPTRPTIF